MSTDDNKFKLELNLVKELCKSYKLDFPEFEKSLKIYDVGSIEWMNAITTFLNVNINKELDVHPVPLTFVPAIAGTVGAGIAGVVANQAGQAIADVAGNVGNALKDVAVNRFRSTLAETAQTAMDKGGEFIDTKADEFVGNINKLLDSTNKTNIETSEAGSSGTSRSGTRATSITNRSNSFAKEGDFYFADGQHPVVNFSRQLPLDNCMYTNTINNSNGSGQTGGMTAYMQNADYRLPTKEGDTSWDTFNIQTQSIITATTKFDARASQYFPAINISCYLNTIALCLQTYYFYTNILEYAKNNTPNTCIDRLRTIISAEDLILLGQLKSRLQMYAIPPRMIEEIQFLSGIYQTTDNSNTAPVALFSPVPFSYEAVLDRYVLTDTTSLYANGRGIKYCVDLLGTTFSNSNYPDVWTGVQFSTGFTTSNWMSSLSGKLSRVFVSWYGNLLGSSQTTTFMYDPDWLDIYINQIPAVHHGADGNDPIPIVCKSEYNRTEEVNDTMITVQQENPGTNGDHMIYNRFDISANPSASGSGAGGILVPFLNGKQPMYDSNGNTAGYFCSSRLEFVRPLVLTVNNNTAGRWAYGLVKDCGVSITSGNPTVATSIATEHAVIYRWKTAIKIATLNAGTVRTFTTHNIALFPSTTVGTYVLHGNDKKARYNKYLEYFNYIVSIEGAQARSNAMESFSESEPSPASAGKGKKKKKKSKPKMK